MDEFASLLRIKKSGDHVLKELVLDAEVTLEVLIEELKELLLQLLRGSTLCEGKVFVVGELTEVLREDVFEVVKHLVKCLDLCCINFSLFNLFNFILVFLFDNHFFRFLFCLFLLSGLLVSFFVFVVFLCLRLFCFFLSLSHSFLMHFFFSLD